MEREKNNYAYPVSVLRVFLDLISENASSHVSFGILLLLLLLVLICAPEPRNGEMFYQEIKTHKKCRF